MLCRGLFTSEESSCVEGNSFTCGGNFLGGGGQGYSHVGENMQGDIHMWGKLMSGGVNSHVSKTCKELLICGGSSHEPPK